MNEKAAHVFLRYSSYVIENFFIRQKYIASYKVIPCFFLYIDARKGSRQTMRKNHSRDQKPLARRSLFRWAKEIAVGASVAGLAFVVTTKSAFGCIACPPAGQTFWVCECACPGDSCFHKRGDGYHALYRSHGGCVNNQDCGGCAEGNPVQIGGCCTGCTCGCEF
jgi:hypothetical protein